MSNLYKGQINQNRKGVYTRVIDHNELLEQKLSAISFEQETKLKKQRLALARQRAQAAAEAGDTPAEGADVPQDAALPEGGVQAAEFSEGLFGMQLNDIPPEMEIDYVEQAKEKADQIMAQATADAEEILKKAVKEAENLKETARKQGEAEGYARGMERVQSEEAQMRQQLEYLRQEQERAYEQRLQAMEPELMEAVIEVFDHVLQTDFETRKNVLLHLIRQTVQHIKNSREFRVRVSAPDYPAVSGGREEILKKIGGEVTLDIVMDESMQQGQCTIDTDEGIFECGIDAQFTNLVKDLKALSCMG